MIEVPIIALFFAPSWIFAVFYLFFGIRPHIRSPGLATLNFNLAKIGMFWSNGKGSFEALHEGAIDEDRTKMYRTFFFMTALLSLMSIVGMILLMLIFVSGRPRLELNTFRSELVRNCELSSQQVQELVEELKSLI